MREKEADYVDPRMRLRPNAGDKLHALQLSRDLELINERTQRDLGPLPAGGLPGQIKRKPQLPKREANRISELAHDFKYNEELRGDTFAQYAQEPTSITEPVMHNPLPSLGIGLMLSLAACDSSPSYVEHKLNPHPKEAYEITMTLTDAPGPFASMVGLAQYDVVTQQCLSPPDSNPGGAGMHMSRDVEFALARVSDVEYKGTVYADGLLDEEYYGRGVCHWQLTQARVHLKATGTPSETLFSASLSAEPLLAEKTETIYFLKEAYPRHPESTLDDFLYFGQTDRSKMASFVVDEDLFTITMASRKLRESARASGPATVGQVR